MDKKTDKQKKKSGSTQELANILWYATLACEEIIKNPDTSPSQKLKAMQTLKSLSKSYIEVQKKAENEEFFGF